MPRRDSRTVVFSTVTASPTTGTSMPRASRSASRFAIPRRTRSSLPPRMRWNVASSADSVDT